MDICQTIWPAASIVCVLSVLCVNGQLYPSLSATRVFLYSACPIGPAWLICQAVCWPPLRTVRYSGLALLVQERLICRAAPPDVFLFVHPRRASRVQPTECSQLTSQYGWWMLRILSFFFLFLCPTFVTVLISLSPSTSLSLNLLLDFNGGNWRAELWFASKIVARSATCQRDLSRDNNTTMIKRLCVCVLVGCVKESTNNQSTKVN